jgi:hypothetical protein
MEWTTAGTDMLDWIIKWSHVIEPHIFSFAQPDIQMQLTRTCPSEWIEFIDQKSIENQDLLKGKLLDLMKFSDPSTAAQVPDEDYWPESLVSYLIGEILS